MDDNQIYVGVGGCLGFLVWIPAFFGIWGSLIGSFGLLGFCLGWFPAFWGATIIALIVAVPWPLYLAGALLIWLLSH